MDPLNSLSSGTAATHLVAGDAASLRKQIQAAQTSDSEQALQERRVQAARKAEEAELKATQQRDAELRELKQRDSEVRAHEMAHLIAAGQHARGGAQYEYKAGPDGHLYAVGGEVEIDAAPIPGDPEASLRKAEIVRRAALAPAEPSPQDRQIAAQAAAMAMQARIEINQQRAQEQQANQQEQTTIVELTPSESHLGENLDLLA